MKCSSNDISRVDHQHQTTTYGASWNIYVSWNVGSKIADNGRNLLMLLTSKRWEHVRRYLNSAFEAISICLIQQTSSKQLWSELLAKSLLIQGRSSLLHSEAIQDIQREVNTLSNNDDNNSNQRCGFSLFLKTKCNKKSYVYSR